MRLHKFASKFIRLQGKFLRPLGNLPLVLLLAAALTLPAFEPAMALSDYRAAIVIDMHTGQVLFSHAADTKRYPASLTKVMTLYILFGYLRDGRMTMDSPLVVTPHAAAQAPTKLNLKPGDTIRTEDAIRALVTQSANDVAVTVGENIAGTESNFARMMTQKAHQLGMSNTVYRNASGLPNDEQVTTARDQALLAERMMRDFPQYYHFFSLTSFTYHGRRYRNHNHLLTNYQGTDGIKTGYTRAAGFNLTASVHHGDKHLLAVVLGGHTSRGRDATMRYLLDKYFPKASNGRDYDAPQVVAMQNPGMPLRAPYPTSTSQALASAAAPAPEPVIGGPGPSRSPVQTISYTADQPQGVNIAEPVPELKPSLGAGPYQVQVGSYTSASDARNRLDSVEGKAGSLLDGHQPVTTSFSNDGTQWYRARFAGFSEDQAQSVCQRLKRLSVDCIAMKSD
jgi:D-alanyl-D-alanine carboxypeptidase